MYLSGLSNSVVLVGSFICLLNLFLVSSRFLQMLIALEQLNALLLLSSIFSLGGEGVYFLVFMVMFTIEAVISLVVLTRIWSGAGLVGLSCW